LAAHHDDAVLVGSGANVSQQMHDWALFDQARNTFDLIMTARRDRRPSTYTDIARKRFILQVDRRNNTVN
jgi:hypothetical protein